ncbi:hypothetical protein BDY19DRAFT_940978 [Irpex rosettiformis]|uniref:Uncharacterized protein n=1 Tax=Irpex rosettiformis TaxID=378272 RepID=A0ACB8U645_9APHY|nr:hypothetical protein BDY19DRAFT_940978 [Irpex rosettiformis]
MKVRSLSKSVTRLSISSGLSFSSLVVSNRVKVAERIVRERSVMANEASYSSFVMLLKRDAAVSSRYSDARRPSEPDKLGKLRGAGGGSLSRLGGDFFPAFFFFCFFCPLVDVSFAGSAFFGGASSTETFAAAAVRNRSSSIAQNICDEKEICEM